MAGSGAQLLFARLQKPDFRPWRRAQNPIAIAVNRLEAMLYQGSRAAQIGPGRQKLQSAIGIAKSVKLRKPIVDRGSGRLGDFELHRTPRLLLNDSGAVTDAPAGADIVNLQPHEIAASEFTIDGEVEHREIAGSVLQLEPDPD